MFRIRVHGLEHLPERGPVILAANHQSFCDSLFVPVVIPRRVTYLAKAEYFDHWHTRAFMSTFGQIPIRRGSGSESIRALSMASELLEQGAVLGLYPEGTRSRDGTVHRGHTGAARLALLTGAPVVPVGISGTEFVQPVGSSLLRPFGRISIALGEARLLTQGDVTAHGAKKLALRAFTDAVMRDIARLAQREYEDHYLEMPGAQSQAV
jgi:1-acyl-sn-glycerol-3-phosphate acyltransferase